MRALVCFITHGIYDYRPLRADRKAQLEGLRTGDGRPLPPRLRAEILRELQRLELVLQMIADVRVPSRRRRTRSLPITRSTLSGHTIQTC
jgi:hypothetical protein